MKRIVLSVMSRSLMAVLALSNRRWPSAFLEEVNTQPEAYCEVAIRGTKAVFYCPDRICRYRAETAFTKEPETIEWIETFNEGEIFWDVGANVGVFSLYAALARRTRVVAFEPSPFNIGILARNVASNRLDERVWAFGIALGDRSGRAYLEMQDTAPGGAGSSFGTNLDHRGKPFATAYRHMTIGYSIDDFIAAFDVPAPNHLKVDVDGNEGKIVAGAFSTLARRELRSVLIELDDAREAETRDIAATLAAHGFERIWKRQAPRAAGSPFASSFNCLFRRL